jgi:hypothetical protein
MDSSDPNWSLHEAYIQYKVVLCKIEITAEIFVQSHFYSNSCYVIGCQMLRIPYYVDNWLTGGGKVVSLTHRPRSTPQKHYFSAAGADLC